MKNTPELRKIKRESYNSDISALRELIKLKDAEIARQIAKRKMYCAIYNWILLLVGIVFLIWWL